jgi:rhodanese-related sulfurtransferase
MPHWLTLLFGVPYDDFHHGGVLMGFTITPKDLKSRLDKGEKLVLVDVREPWEHALAKLDGSILIPLATLPQSLDKLDRNAEIIAYCHHGMRSGDATSFLLQQGFPNVKNLIGGIDAWSVQIDPSVPRY